MIHLVHAQKVQLSHFQRYRFGSLKTFVQNSTRDRLDENGTKLWQFMGLDALQYETTLLGFPAEVEYHFQAGRLSRINYSTNCYVKKVTTYFQETQKRCAEETLQEFFELKRVFEELFGSGGVCIGCQVCYTRNIEIPSFYSISFLNQMTKIHSDYPDNPRICTRWFDYTNNSEVTLSYDVELGWVIGIAPLSP